MENKNSISEYLIRLDKIRDKIFALLNQNTQDNFIGIYKNESKNKIYLLNNKDLKCDDLKIIFEYECIGFIESSIFSLSTSLLNNINIKQNIKIFLEEEAKTKELEIEEVKTEEETISICRDRCFIHDPYMDLTDYFKSTQNIEQYLEFLETDFIKYLKEKKEQIIKIDLIKKIKCNVVDFIKIRNKILNFFNQNIQSQFKFFGIYYDELNDNYIKINNSSKKPTNLKIILEYNQVIQNVNSFALEISLLDEEAIKQNIRRFIQKNKEIDINEDYIQNINTINLNIDLQYFILYDYLYGLNNYLKSSNYFEQYLEFLENKFYNFITNIDFSVKIESVDLEILLKDKFTKETIKCIRVVFEELEKIGFNFKEKLFKNVDANLLDLSTSFLYYHSYLTNDDFIEKYKMPQKLNFLKKHKCLTEKILKSPKTLLFLAELNNEEFKDIAIKFQILRNKNFLNQAINLYNSLEFDHNIIKNIELNRFKEACKETDSFDHFMNKINK